MFIRVYTNESSDVVLNSDTIARASFARKDDLRQSERSMKVLFTDGSTGEYIIHRNEVKRLKGELKSCTCEKEAEVEA